jgi:diguanylate cyclase (GGDEF)-like protein/PAS domain S-box-containing protein
VVYSLLALFDVLVVGTGLVYINRIVQSYNHSVTTSRVWMTREGQISTLEDAASGVMAPANQVFGSLDTQRANQALGVAVDGFTTRAEILRADLVGLAGHSLVQLLDDLSAAESSVDTMRVASGQVIAAVGRDDFKAAVSGMVAVDADQRNLTDNLAALRADMQAAQTQVFDRQQHDIASLQRFEYLIEGLFLLMVLAATIYGSRLRSEFERRTDERERHVRELEATQAELTEARNVLEERVVARTEELAAANAALRDEIEERRRAEADLRLSEERYALAAHSANDGLWDWDLRTNQFYSSPRWRALLGYGDGELSGGVNEWLDRVHPDDRVNLQIRIGTHLQDPSSPLEVEHRVLHRDGEYRWMLVRATAVTDDKAQPVRMVGSHADVSARKNAELALLHVAMHDTLTGLPNRACFMAHLDTVLRDFKASGGSRFAVLFVDLDRFKVVNDSLGHTVGDELLSEVARRITSVVRPGDMVARLGGDEFTVLVEHLGSDDNAYAVAERVLAALGEPAHLDGYEVRANASIGVAFVKADYTTPAEILRDADTAMYQAKSDGRGLYRVFEPSMYDTALDNLVLESELSIAVEREQFRVLYQPVVALADGGVVGLEALVRWQHPTRGLISPATFVAIAEGTGDIVPLGRWVLEQAAAQATMWRQRPGSEQLFVSVNVSPRELWQHDFPDYVAALLSRHGLAAGALRLEVPEASLMRHRDETVATLRRLRVMGVGVSIDDFGTAPGDPNYVADLPVDAIKLDRSVVAPLGATSADTSLAAALVGVGRGSNLAVVAEGVETLEQQAALVALGCPFGQGYRFYEPLTSAEIDGVLANAGSKITG